ncbi:IS3 family transposase [Globicatella sulfidifaciens]|uniref:IS3 family transposase n=1 Tax=Globicatella sulfidifaciens TaxID=136093 RepID=A0A7X8C225_9LACT|nr:IS3 family transposase [Globicatella sulfidifaciens]NLJ17551.1 IS3 family transposase [Globicatella sulfidifaciens]
MFAYEDKLKAIKLYLKYESYAAAINELGYPSRGALIKWVKEYKDNGDIRKENTRKSKYTNNEKQQAVDHYLEFGKCYSHTCRMLGYPSRELLRQWVKDLAPESRKLKRNGLTLTSDEKEAAVLSLLTRGDTSAQSVADKVGVSWEVLYKHKDQLLSKGVPINKMSESTNTDINKLKDQVKQLQEEVYYLQMQKDILEKAGEIIKKDQGIFLEKLTNREKTILIDAIRPKYKLSQLLIIVDNPKSSYCYHKKQLALPDKYQDVRAKIIDIFERNKRRYGYRRLHASLKNSGILLSEKVVRRIMREETLIVKTIKMRKYNSYHGEISPAVPNILQRDFKADKPNEKWVTDITEFSIPAGKVYLSPMVDCFDGAVVSWTISTSPNEELVNTMLDQAVSILQKDEQAIIHTDRGAHYRWQGWIDRMDNNNLIRSMSKKGCTPDNAACEGFFERLKNEFFYGESWIDISIEDFIELLDEYLEWYNNKRIKLSLGGISIMKYRESLKLIA